MDDIKISTADLEYMGKSQLVLVVSAFKSFKFSFCDIVKNDQHKSCNICVVGAPLIT